MSEVHDPYSYDQSEADKYVMRISATPTCNLDCNYCTPDRSNKSYMSDEDLLGIIEAGVKAGVNKVAWTGGEPTVRPNLLTTMEKAKELGVNHQSMTTNGITIGKKMEEYSKAGLERVNISLETFDKQKYKEITKVDGLDRVLYSIAEATKYLSRVKINAVITRETVDVIPQFVEFAQQFDNLVVRFLEIVPCGNDFEEDSSLFQKMFVSVEEMKSTLEQFGALTPVGLKGYVPKSKYFEIEGKKGIFGVNPNHSVNFHCDQQECTKIRVNPQGIISNCTVKLDYCRDFTGLTQEEKDNLMKEIVAEKVHRDYTGFQHKQKYYDFWRFGKAVPGLYIPKKGEAPKDDLIRSLSFE